MKTMTEKQTHENNDREAIKWQISTIIQSVQHTVPLLKKN